MKILIPSIVLALYLTYSVNLSAQDVDCTKAQNLVASRTAVAIDNLAGLKSIVSNLENPTVPIAVLFQTDISDQAAVDAKIVTLSKTIDLANIGDTDEFKSLKKCLPNSKELEILIDLRHKVNLKKIEFFSLPREKRIEIASIYEKSRNSKLETEKITTEMKDVATFISESEQRSESQANSDSGNENQSILALLNAASAGNEKKYLDFLAFLKETKQALDSISSNYENNKDKGDITSQLIFVKILWRELFDELKGLFPRLNSFNLADLPVISPDIVLNKELQATVVKAKNRQLEIISNITRMIESLKSDSFVLLSEVGTKRARLISTCDKANPPCARSRGLSEENLHDINRELRIIPLKVEAGLAAKWFEGKRKFNSGLDGWLDLAYQFILLFGLLISPIIMSRLLDWLTRWLDSFRANLVSKSVLDYRQRTNYAIILVRLIPFVTPLGMLAFSFIAENQLLKTDTAELALFIFYLQVYYGYKLSSLVIKMVLQALFATEIVENIKANKSRISKSAKNISRLIFFEIAVLHLIGDTAREALVYNLMSNVILWINVLLVLHQCREWGSEIELAFAQRYPYVWKKIQPSFTKVTRFFVLPLMFLSCLGFDIFRILIVWLSKFNLTKTILSEIFKKKLQGAELVSKDSKPPGQDYLKFFDYYLPAEDSFFVQRENSILQGVAEKIANWKNGSSSDDLVVIVGNRGMGKSTTLDKLYSAQKGELSADFGKVPAKTLSPEAFYLWLSGLVGQPIHSLNEFKEFDSSLPGKRVFFIDDLQNFFISAINGFSAYEILIELVGLKTKNIFWTFTVNSRSWTYLKGVFGDEHFYGTNYLLNPWKDTEIKQLIVLRHEKTNYKRQYDESIKAYGTSDSLGQKAEAQFFRLLWGQSRGNPRSAMMYWVSAVFEAEEKTIHVGVPEFVDSGPVGRMSDEGHFLLASIARHESLNYDELIQVTGVNAATVRKCLKEFGDKKLTWNDEEGRVRISSKSQYVVDYFLIGKNFLYE